MQADKKNASTAKNAKDYLSRNEIPQLFECLMTGLMYHRPSDHILYLEECLGRIKKQGVKGVRWDMFLEAKKTPLPPIDTTPKDDYRPQPLPDIGTVQLNIASDASMIIIQAGPGLDKSAICRQLCSSFPGYVHIELGAVLRERALLEAQDNESRWQTVRGSINDGELVDEEFVVESLIKELNKHGDKSNFLIEGYPRTTKEREDFERFIGLNRVKFMLLIDCEEEVCKKILMERSPLHGWFDHTPVNVDKRLLNYKMNALPVCKYFDDQNKLRTVDGDQDRDTLMKEIHQLFIKDLNEPILPHPPMSPRVQELSNVVKSGRESAISQRRLSQNEELTKEASNVVSPAGEPITEIEQLTGIADEGDRNPELPQCHFILVLGGPGSGKSEVVSSVCSLHSSWVHIDVNEILRSNIIDSDTPDNGLATSDDNQPFVENWTIDINALKESIKSVAEGTDVVILDGFPKDAGQLNQFNIEIGRADLVILIDSEEDVMRARLADRYDRVQRVEDDEINSDLRIVFFKNNGLPLCRYYDERNRMSIVAGDRDLHDVAADFEKVAMSKLQIISSQVAVDDAEDTSRTNETINDDVATAAAVTIQASIRGHFARKKLKKISESKLIIDNGPETEEVVEKENEPIADITGSETEDISNEEEDVTDLIDKTEDITVEEEKVEVDESEPNVEGTEELSGEVIVTEAQIEKDDNDEDIAKETNDNKDEVEEVIEPVTEFPLGKNGLRTNSQLELKEAHVVLLIGGPGSGKKTLGSHIVSKFALPIIHVDQIISSAIELESEDSEEFKKFLANEECDETPIHSMIRKALMNSLGTSKVLFLTGFPKTVEQLQRFYDNVCPVAATIFLDVDEDTLKGRVSDSEQSSDYADQLDLFKNNSPALLEELSKTDLFNKVDATQDRDAVLEQVNEIIENFHFVKSEE